MDWNNLDVGSLNNLIFFGNLITLLFTAESRSLLLLQRQFHDTYVDGKRLTKLCPHAGSLLHRIVYNLWVSPWTDAQ